MTYGETTVKAMVLLHLQKLKADGLVNERLYCGCGLEGLVKCGTFEVDCVAAEKTRNALFASGPYDHGLTPLQSDVEDVEELKSQ